MKTKTFKIGEYAIGGIIKVISTNNYTDIITLDYNSKKEILNQRFFRKDLTMWMYLGDLTSSYYADKIYNYIKEIN